MLQVRPAEFRDLDTLVRFSLNLALESEGRDVDLHAVRAGVKALLEGLHGFILVAEDDAQLVGMIMVGGKEWSDWSNGLFWWTTGMYVCPEARRAGVLRGLYQRVRELAQVATPQVVGIRGYVRATNVVGQVVHERIGRRKSGYRIFEDRFEATSETADKDNVDAKPGVPE